VSTNGPSIFSPPSCAGARSRQLFAARHGVGRTLLSFACLGLGYMLAEISLIQRFVFYQAHPAYTNTILIAVLLVSSGTDSLLTGRRSLTPRAVVLASVACIVAYSACPRCCVRPSACLWRCVPPWTSAGFTGDVGGALLYAVAGILFMFMGRSAEAQEPGF
jgi:hypothetical protein